MDVQKNLADLSLGKLPEHKLPQKDDVIGAMVQALMNLNESFNKTSSFANDIGHGNLNADFAPLSEHDRLGNALLSMRQSLKAYSEEMEQKVADRTIEITKKKEQLEIEKKKSDDLLLNILPYEIAEELKVNGKAKARSTEFAAVMFSDMVDFTKMAEKLSPEELVTRIDFYFRKFDEIVGKYHIEKIKTIGDAYMCAAGIPTPNANAAEDMILAALEMREFVEELVKANPDGARGIFQIRFGIHCGPVVAGIVGMKKFAYDVWGDTVNTAARMEQKSEACKINISETTYELVKDKFICEYRGELEAKNKGKMKMYFVVGKR
jgi:class 3 adenylate cyclase